MKKFNLLKHKLSSLGRPRKGISLVEVIVSIALLGIVVILIGNMLMTGFYITTISKQKAKNAYNVGGTVGTASQAAGNTTTSGNVTVNAAAGTATVSFDNGTTSTITGTYQNGATDGATSSQYNADNWTFNPTN